LITLGVKTQLTLNLNYVQIVDAKKLHNLFVIKEYKLIFFLDDSYASAAHSEILLYIQVSWKCMAKKLRVAGDDE
jgi:hypothetical protein